MRSGEYWVCGCEHDNHHELSEKECPHCGWYLDMVADEVDQLIEDISQLERQRARLWKRLKSILRQQHFKGMPVYQRVMEVMFR